MYEINVVCRCIKSEWHYNLTEGLLHGGKVVLDRTGDTLFIIYHQDGSEIKCIQKWFENYFELVK